MIKKILILSILILGFFVRLYKIDNPVADWHSFRQADTASVSRGFIEKGVNLLVPTYHDNSNIQSGKDNPNGYRMVEFPLYNLTHYLVFNLHPQWGVDKSGRLTSVFLSIVSIYLTYLVGSKLSGVATGLLAALFMAVLPFNVYYSRVILPEPLMVCATLASYWYLIKMSESSGIKKRMNLLVSGIFFSVAVLVKPFAIFFILPHLAIILRSLAKREISVLDSLIFFGLGFYPLFWWRKHILLYPSGIPASDWLLNTNGIRFRPAWFRWLFEERLASLILGTYGIVFLILGLIAKPLKEGVSYWLWFIGILIYFSVVAGGNVQHDYYQAITVPFLSLILAKGVVLMLSLSQETYSRFLTIIMATVVFFSMVFISWYRVKGYYQINNWPIVEAGMEADKILPKNAKIIAPYNGDTAFLYQTHRSGWPLGYDIEDKITKGATHYVSVVYDDEARALEKKYTLLKKTDKYIIIELAKP